MPVYLDESEYNRWQSHAKSTLRSAQIDKSSGFYNWACFKAQQVAEYMAKALLRGMGIESYGHSVSQLLKNAEFNEKVLNLAKKIDKYYIPTRYTDAWSEGLPEDYYTLEDAEDAIMCAESVMIEVEERWKSLKNAEGNAKK
jgi:HEPN domain-containing protein